MHQCGHSFIDLQNGIQVFVWNAVENMAKVWKHVEPFDQGLGSNTLWDGLSAIKVQKHNDHIAVLKRLKLSTDFAPRSLRCLAELGTSGTHPNHCHKNLISLPGTPNFPEAHVEVVPM